MPPPCWLAIDCEPPRYAGTSLQALGLAWATLVASPPGTVVAISGWAGHEWAMKTTDRMEVILVPF